MRTALNNISPDEAISLAPHYWQQARQRDEYTTARDIEDACYAARNIESMLKATFVPDDPEDYDAWRELDVSSHEENLAASDRRGTLSALVL